MNFEKVTIKKADGQDESLSAAQFAEMPLTDRVKLVSSGKVIFFRNGQIIPAVEALRRTETKR